MPITFKPVPLEQVQPQLSQHLSALPSAIDCFLEAHILESHHYAIQVSGELAGLAAVHKGSLITHFSLSPQHGRLGQAVFAQLRKLEEVQAALVPTCDEFFLSHALDDYRQLAKQAYFFAAQPQVFDLGGVSYGLRLADEGDLELIAHSSGDFFGDAGGIAHKVRDGEVYLVLEGLNCLAFGVLERGKLLPTVASIGMFVIPEQRQKGIGAATLKLLAKECQRQGLRPVAGCWYYNHLSKKTLERAGMYSQTRLLRVEY